MEVSPLVKYLAYQLYTARQLAPGISKNSDPEDLHKFRVAIRRTRSLLTLYLTECYALSDILKNIVTQTNEMRELDVFLNEISPEEYPRVYRELQDYRDEVFERTLTKKWHSKTVERLDALYNDLFNITVELSAENLIHHSTQHYKRTMQGYRSLKGDETEELLHRLRIKFKIARYASDFLTRSGIKNEKRKIAKCEEAQDHLGAIQDARNQLEWLEHFCNIHPSKECRRLIKTKKKSLKNLKKATTSSR